MPLQEILVSLCSIFLVEKGTAVPPVYILRHENLHAPGMGTAKPGSIIVAAPVASAEEM